jgi:hypothetical protein
MKKKGLHCCGFRYQHTYNGKLSEGGGNFVCISTVLDLYFLWDWIGRFSRGSNRMYVCEGKDEAMASRGAIFQSVAGRESGVTVLVVSFAIFISTRPDLRDFLTSIRSVQNYNRFLVYLTIYRSIEI